MTIQLSVRHVRADDALARPLLADLEREYDTRYGDHFGEPASVELQRYAASEFAPPNGAFLLLLEDGEPVAGGAFKRFDHRTAELKRVWTRADRRGRGLGRRIVAELESTARYLGYTRVYLTTGFRQPEAVALYLASGYTPRFDPALPAEEIGIHAFDKSLVTEGVRA